MCLLCRPSNRTIPDAFPDPPNPPPPPQFVFSKFSSRHARHNSRACLLASVHSSVVSQISSLRNGGDILSPPFYAITGAPTLSLQTSVGIASGVDASNIVYLPVYTAGASVHPNQPDGVTAVYDLMLPNANDDQFACANVAMQTENEFNQTFAGAWIVIETSNCPGRGAISKYLVAARTGAAGILSIGWYAIRTSCIRKAICVCSWCSCFVASSP